MEEKKMKKLLAVLMAALLLVGCSSETTTETTTETLVVGMECDYAPYNWSQLEDTEFSEPITEVDYCDGYDVSIARELANSLGMELQVKAIAWDGLIPSLTNGEIDVILAGMTDTPDRRESVSFTEPYYESEMVVVVANDSEYANITSIQELSGANVVGQADTIYDEVIDQINGVNHLTPQESFSRSVLSVNVGEADALVGELPAALGAVAANPDLTIVRFEGTNGFDADTTVSIAVRLEDDQLETDLNTALAEISEDDRVQMMADAGDRQPSAQ
jgi:putative lysine transport system substrate-binding protein/putative lysine transport system permease protein